MNLFKNLDRTNNKKKLAGDDFAFKGEINFRNKYRIDKF